MATSALAIRAQLGRAARYYGNPTKSLRKPRQTLSNSSVLQIYAKGLNVNQRTFHDNSTDSRRPSTTSEAHLPLDTFARRHIGPSEDSIQEMLKALDPPVKSLDDFVKQVLPADILSSKTLKIDTEQSARKDAFTESEVLDILKKKNGKRGI